MGKFLIALGVIALAIVALVLMIVSSNGNARLVLTLISLTPVIVAAIVVIALGCMENALVAIRMSSERQEALLSQLVRQTAAEPAAMTHRPAASPPSL